MKHSLSITSGLLVSSCIAAVVSIVGNFDTRYAYCDYTTKPCTQVVVPSWYVTNTPENARVLGGSSLPRTIGSLLGLGTTVLAVITSANAVNKQRTAEEENFKTKILEEERQRILQVEELQKIEAASEMRVADFKRELQDGYAYLHLEENPHLVDKLTQKPMIEGVREIEEGKDLEPLSDKEERVREIEESPVIPPVVDLILNSELAEIVDAGMLSLVGAQGSGKTSTSCMLLRYRVWKGHKLVILNPHKRKCMYKGLESFLLQGTTFYGVGRSDAERAQSLMDGMETILKLAENRYNDYQNLDEGSYDHFPITLLLEECAEYTSLLSHFNRPPNPKAEDPGFSAKRYVIDFWRRMLTAIRKGNTYLIRTIQYDTNTMNGTEGLSDAFKHQGGCSLTQFSVPDGSCIGGWRSTGKGKIKIPNQEYVDAEGKPVDAKSVTVPTYFDYIKLVEKIDDYSDLAPVTESTVTTKPQTETEDIDPETLWQKAIARLENTLSVDAKSVSLGESGNLPPIHPEIEETRNQETAGETALSGKEQEKSYTPDSLSKQELILKIKQLQEGGSSQTKTIELLWQVQKNRSGWKQAYKEYLEIRKEL